MAAYKFWGHYQHSLDSKNRVAIPAKFRQQIEDGKVVVTKFFGGCLAVYPESEWEKLLENELSDLHPITSTEGRRIERTLFGSAFPCEVDKQGRINLSAYHLKQAGIKKEVVFKGLNNKFEIWDKERWEAWEEAEDQRDGQEE
jgi:MraZ protein